MNRPYNPPIHWFYHYKDPGDGSLLIGEPSCLICELIEKRKGTEGGPPEPDGDRSDPQPPIISFEPVDGLKPFLPPETPYLCKKELKEIDILETLRDLLKDFLIRDSYPYPESGHESKVGPIKPYNDPKPAPIDGHEPINITKPVLPGFNSIDPVSGPHKPDTSGADPYGMDHDPIILPPPPGNETECHSEEVH